MATILSRWAMFVAGWLIGMALGLDGDRLLLLMILGYENCIMKAHDFSHWDEIM